MRYSAIVLLVLIALSCLALSALAANGMNTQTASKATDRSAPEQEIVVKDPLGRSTPEGTVRGFTRSVSQKDYSRALQYLNTTEKGKAGEQLADELYAVLDRGFSGKAGILSSSTEGNLGDKERLGTMVTRSSSTEIFLERIEQESGPPIWLFSAETLAKVPGIYKELDDDVVEKYLPEFLVEATPLGFPRWQWGYILGAVPLSFILARFVVLILAGMLPLVFRRITKAQSGQYMLKQTAPMRLLILSACIWILSFLSDSIVASSFWSYVGSVITVAGTVWFLMRLMDTILMVKEKDWTVSSTGMISVIRLVSNLSKILVVLTGVVVIVYISGFNVTAALAGFGIGGIAIAFAAQKTLENLFGGIMIIADRPISVGDFCRAGGHTGTVEHIGLRSTYIRTLDHTLLSIPNGQLALMSIENFSRRSRILFRHAVNLCYETTPDRLRYVMDEIRKMLHEHPRVESSTVRVRFVKFEESSLTLDVFAYVWESEYSMFLEIQEGLLLRIMEIVEASGAKFAFPSRTLYISSDEGGQGIKTV
jgi:MscS family membrane protein